jgi:5-methylcytosine-specific restriction endonuclease McrA
MSDTLVLNADGAPVNFLPLSTVDWQEAIRYMVLEKAHVVAWHDDWVVRSARWETAVPAVIMLKDYMKPKTGIRFSKSNVFLRDRYTCQYCHDKLEKRECTLDHVLPTSMGGKTTFENTTTACGPCNANKGANHKIKPKIKPYKPEYYELVNKRKSLPFHVRHDSWLDYIKV